MIKVIGLHNHIVELQKAEALFHPLLIALGPEHIVHREAGAHLPQQVDIVQLQQPVRIIEHHSLAVAKLNEPFHLLFETVTVVLNRLRGHHGTHIRPAGGVADIAGAAANQCDRAVARHLEPLHQAQRHKVSHMERIGRGVKANVKHGFAVVHQLPNFLLIRDLSNQLAGLQFLINLHCFSPFPISFRTEIK